MPTPDKSTNIILAITIVFLVVAVAGLLVYTAFFVINKLYFRKQLKLIKKWNQIQNGINSINIFKIQVLDNHDIGNKLELKRYISMYQKLKVNLEDAKKNINTSLVELNLFNLKITKNYQNLIEQDLNKALENLDKLKTAYDHYTQYGTTVQIATQNLREIYEKLSDFFFQKVQYHENFTKISDLISATKLTFESMPKLSNEFDYKTTYGTLIDLKDKLKTLADVIPVIYRFQIVSEYLRASKNSNDKIIAAHYDEIDARDLQTLQDLLTIFNHAYKGFVSNYAKLELTKAKQFGINAINTLNQVNQFTYIHLSTPAFIAAGLNEIKEQSDRILDNKNDIINSLRELKQYFVLEPKIISNFDTIEKNINYIDVLNNAAKQVNYSTHNEKVNAISELNNIGNLIVRNKQEIVESIDLINDTLAKVIKTVTDLNDMYICFWQLLAFIKRFVPDDEENKYLTSVIESNIKQIEECSKQIVTDKQPDFDAIASNLTSIIDQGNQISQRLTSSYVIKTYASKLLIYANRYRKYNDLKTQYSEADRLFKTKQYDACIEQLLKIIKQSKKYKNKQA